MPNVISSNHRRVPGAAFGKMSGHICSPSSSGSLREPSRSSTAFIILLLKVEVIHHSKTAISDHSIMASPPLQLKYIYVKLKSSRASASASVNTELWMLTSYKTGVHPITYTYLESYIAF